MAAVLEAAPDHSDRFEAASPGRASALARLSVLGLRSVFKIKLGLVIYAFLRLRA